MDHVQDIRSFDLNLLYHSQDQDSFAFDRVVILVARSPPPT